MSQLAFFALVLGFVWLLQLMLSLLQTRRFYRRFSELRQGSYASAIGMAGTTWKRKEYAILVVDSDHRVMRAQRLGGITVFATPKPLPALEGVALDRFSGAEAVDGVSAKTWAALQNAAQYIRDHIERKRREAEGDDASSSAGGVEDGQGT